MSCGENVYFVIKKKERNQKLQDKHTVCDRVDTQLCRKPAGQQRGQRTCRVRAPTCLLPPRHPLVARPRSLSVDSEHSVGGGLAGRVGPALTVTLGSRTPGTPLQKATDTEAEERKCKVKKNSALALSSSFSCKSLFCVDE